MRDQEFLLRLHDKANENRLLTTTDVYDAVRGELEARDIAVHVVVEQLTAFNTTELNGKYRNELMSFVAYCAANPGEHFWQALRNWSRYNFILASDGPHPDYNYYRDTFAWEGKRHDDRSNVSKEV